MAPAGEGLGRQAGMVDRRAAHGQTRSGLSAGHHGPFSPMVSIGIRRIKCRPGTGVSSSALISRRLLFCRNAR